jgi:hypothetical protein
MNIQLHLDETLSPDPEVLYFTPEAKELLFKWEKSNVDQCNEVESDVIAGIYSKLEMYIARLALILQLLFWACNESDNQAVGIDAVQGAIQLIEYFKRSAIKVYSIISNSNPLDKWPEDKQGLYNALPDTFTTKTGQQIAESMGVPERTFKLFLKEKELFNWLSRGNYEKRI